MLAAGAGIAVGHFGSVPADKGNVIVQTDAMTYEISRPKAGALAQFQAYGDVGELVGVSCADTKDAYRCRLTGLDARVSDVVLDDAPKEASRDFAAGMFRIASGGEYRFDCTQSKDGVMCLSQRVEPVDSQLLARRDILLRLGSKAPEAEGEKQVVD